MSYINGLNYILHDTYLHLQQWIDWCRPARYSPLFNLYEFALSDVDPFIVAAVAAVLIVLGCLGKLPE